MEGMEAWEATVRVPVRDASLMSGNEWQLVVRVPVRDTCFEWCHAPPRLNCSGGVSRSFS